jgi:serine/threonine protein phosphatase PrpC
MSSIYKDMSFWTTWLPFGVLKTTTPERKAALEGPSIEEIHDFGEVAMLVADGRQTRAALPFMAGDYNGAVFSSRGRGYARYNEDAGGLFSDKAGRVYAVALDQAGGLGGRIRGEASALAAKEILEACKRYAQHQGAGDALDPVDALLEAFHRAHRDLLVREEGEVTTAVAAMIEGRSVYLVNSGDSGAVLYDHEGTLKTRTVMHEFPPPDQACLRHALGLEPEGAEPTPYAWTMEPGDWLMLGSDGLLDSGMVEDEIGSLLKSFDHAEDAVNQICTFVLRRMGTLRSKPDNLTVVLVHARPRDAG